MCVWQGRFFRNLALAATAGSTLALSACGEVQSVLAPRSTEAEQTAILSWVLLIGGSVIFLAVMGLSVLAIAGSDRTRRRLASPNAIYSGGIAFPLITLTALLVYGVFLIRPGASDDRSPVEIAVECNQWWWRVTYFTDDGSRVESANEIRIPVGRRIRLRLEAADVIHSFWVPQLAGKIDMIPGRTNFLEFKANKSGAFRGQCAEFCGGAHALMGMRVVAMNSRAFSQWLDREREPARAVSGEAAKRGKALFFAQGCQACHTITGTEAVGKAGPDLSHVGGRMMLAAERLSMSQGSLASWIKHSERIKPGNLMPSFSDLSNENAGAIAAYLSELK